MKKEFKNIDQSPKNVKTKSHKYKNVQRTKNIYPNKNL